MVAEPTTPGKVYGYVRVSTDKQSASPEVQRDTIERTAAGLGLAIDAYFQDAPVRNKDGSWNDAVSAKVPLPDRKAGGELVSRLKRGDTVIVSKIDRAFRKLSDCVIMLDRWERLGVTLVLCDFPMLGDLTSPFGKAMVQLVAIFAEIERKLISQRTREALALRKRRGHANGRYPGYGKTWEKRYDPHRGRYVKAKIDCPEERQAMREILRWRLDGHSWGTIVSHLTALGIFTKDNKPWSRSRVQRAFQAELVYQAAENRSTNR